MQVSWAGLTRPGRLSVRFYVKVLAIATTALAVLTGVAAGFQRPVLVAGVTILLATWLVLALHCGYHLLRAHRWRERKRVEERARAALAIPEDVRPPGAFPGVRELDEAQHTELRQTPDYQGRYRATGVKVAFLPALAVGFVSLQGIFFGSRGPAALGLVFGECLLLLILVLVVRTNQQPNLGWVLSRARSELLRREQYLRLAEVGPYLGLGPHRADEVGRSRVEGIRTQDLRRLEEFAVAAERDTSGTGLGPPWLDTLWQTASAPAGPHRPDRVRERAVSYLHYRIGKQLMWFDINAALCRRAERRITRVTQTAVLVAVAVAVVNAVLLSGDWQHGGVYQVTALLAAVLPALCTGLFALHELFVFRSLAVSYGFTRRELTRCKASLSALIERIEAGGGSSTTTEFQALVLRTEDVLTVELQRWVMLVHKPRLDAAL